MDLIERIDFWSQRSPDRLAHVCGGRSLTYRELTLGSDILAAYLFHSLPADAAPVAVVGHKEPEMLISFLGAVKAGHPYIPIDVSTPQVRRDKILQVAGARLTLSPERVAALIGENQLARLPRIPARDDPAFPWYIIFTSGSTGEPKGVVITAGCLSSFLEWMLVEHPLVEQEETFLNQSPFSFDLSVMDLYLSLVTGSRLYSLTSDEIANPRQLFQSLEHSQASVWVSTPSFARMCLVEPSFSARILPGLKRFLFCGETLPPVVAAALLDRFPQVEVWNTYGPTETTVAVTSVRIDRQVLADYNPLPVGYPKPGARFTLLNEDGSLASAGVRGEIVIAGPSVSPGYIGRPELTRQAFIELEGARAYKTGDWGHFLDGMLFFDGRIDNQIKLHGYRIELGDVEANLLAVLGVEDAAVLPVLKEGRPDSLAAFVILSERQPVSSAETTRSLRHALSLCLPAYMIPRQFHYLETFPITPNGKIDRRKLAEGLA